VSDFLDGPLLQMMLLQNDTVHRSATIKDAGYVNGRQVEPGCQGDLGKRFKLLFATQKATIRIEGDAIHPREQKR
jgi:hypothetical protein